MGFWWKFKQKEDYTVYCQLEEKKFCFKVNVEDKGMRTSLRNSLLDKLIVTSLKSKINIIKPKRFGNGRYMTIAILEENYWKINKEEIVDIAQTIKNIKRIDFLLDLI